MSRLHAIQPAGVRDWDSHFIAYATALDDTGFPLRGSFGIGYNCFTDLSTATPADISRAIAATHKGASSRSISDRIALVTKAYAALTPGAVLALKQGAPVIAFIRIVGPYLYDTTHIDAKTNHPHRWNYEVIRKASPSEMSDHSGNHFPTFVHNYAPRPADLDAVAVEAPPSPALSVTEIPAEAATGGAGTETPPSPVPSVTEAPATKAELLAMHREIKRQLAARRATEAAERAAEKAQKAERTAARAARAAEEAVRAAARAEKASAAASKL
jgi:hypothetical protein